MPSTQNPSSIRAARYLHDTLEAAAHGQMEPGRERDPATAALRQAIGRRLRARREQLNMSGAELARSINVGYATTIYDWERGNVPWDRISQLAEVLDVTPDWLLHGESQLDQVRDAQAAIDELLPVLDRLVAALHGLAPGEAGEA